MADKKGTLYTPSSVSVTVACLRPTDGELAFETFKKNCIEPWFRQKKLPNTLYTKFCDEYDLLIETKSGRKPRKPKSKPPLSQEALEVQQLDKHRPSQPQRPISAARKSKQSPSCGQTNDLETNKNVQRAIEDNIHLRNELKDVKDQASEKIANLYMQLHDLETEKQQLIKLVEKFKKDAEDLRRRFSENASEKLTVGNPQISDLSDAYRPTNLSTMFSDIYDNLWTDAFEALEKSDLKESEGISTLFETVLSSYTYCEHIYNYQLQNIRDELLCPFRESSGPAVESRSDSPTNIPPETDLASTTRTDRLVSTLKDVRRLFAEDAAKNVAKGFVQGEFRSSLPPQLSQKVPESLIKYAEKCAELCWFMVLVDPPVALKHSKEGDRFDPDFYKEYTKSVKDVKNAVIEMNVWPALLLHVSGPVLSKGVAQPGQRKSE